MVYYTYRMTDYTNLFQSAFQSIGIALRFWWVYMPVILFFIVYEMWHEYIKDKYIKSLKWILLEVTPPPDVQKSPKIAEIFFSGLHSTYSKPVTGRKRFLEGKVQDWFSFEIVGNEGEMKFYVRTLEGNRNLVESQIFAQYPDAEIKVADSDYIDLLPAKLAQSEYDLFGAELIFTKDNPYPIKTYPFFEEESGKDEFKRTDPLAPLAEIMSTLGPGEHLWLQLVARPTGDGWVREQAQPLIDKIVGKPAKPPAPTFLQNLSGFLDTGINTLMSFLGGGASQIEAKKEDKKDVDPQKLTPGQKFVLEQVENKAHKLAYKAGHRLLYVARKDVFNKGRIVSVIGMFKQLYSSDMNTFKPNGKVDTDPKGSLAWFFPKETGFGKAEKVATRKRKIYEAYRSRSFVEQPNIMSTEEMATVFHLPGLNVKAPALPRVEAKKGQPPVSLPFE